jgi:hypothetical protein
MNINPTEAKIYRSLYDFFEEQNYQLLPEKKQFRKLTDVGFLNVVFSVTEYGPNDALVEVHFGSHHRHLEQIAQQFLATNLLDFRADANTLIVSIGKYNDVKYFRYKIQSEEDLQSVCESVMLFFEQRGFAFLETIDSTASVDKILNTLPLQPCKFLYNQVHRCFKGMVAAKLNDSAILPKLAQTYQQYLQKYANAQEQAQFEKLLAYLLHYSAN